jgi:hypothetical protein
MEVSGRYGFTSFRILPGGTGAQFRTDQGKECTILQDKIIYRDERTVQTSDDFRQDLSGLIRHLRQRLRVPIFVMQLIVVRAIVRPTESMTSKEFIDRLLLRFEPDSFEAFGRPGGIGGIVLIFPRTAAIPDDHRIRIEPFPQDPKMLIVENSARFYTPIQSDEQVEANVAAACDFLRGPVLEFLQNQIPPE